ncbi:glycosyl hydrolase family 18 protein [Krasilnikovia sp. MM14-A1004]|uniref:glycosyl hydrolase family 18 protein n=1 Tax=Krasilnikovia sp. MM14-A1004 TaxID=3373541 RepID=UPI00399C7BE9
MKRSARRAILAAAITTAAVVGVPVVQASAATACASAWAPTQVYVKDNSASQNGHNYTAKWWTQNESPATHSGQWDVWIDNGACDGGTPPTTPPTTEPTTTPPTTTPTTAPTTNPPSGKNLVGYFAEWGIYGRNYHVKNIVTSGSASKLTHILYAFGNTTGGQCSIGDSYADYDKAYTAADSVDGVADTWDAGALRGNFGQLRRLKKLYPNIKVIWSFGGWTWSGGFTQAAANPTGFADSCYNLIKDSRWADVFDGIDIDWEYPNACGLSCDASGPASYDKVISALRNKFGNNFLITSAISADGSNGGKLDAADYKSGIDKLNLVFPMTYDYFGAFSPQGPTAPHSPLTSYAGIPQQGFWSDAAIQKLKSKGVPSSKMLLGIGFYGRGWTGVTQTAPGGTATGAAPGTYEAGIEDYKVLKGSCPATGTVGGTAYAKCGSNWWGYDTPQTVGGKMDYVKQQGLGGAFFWEFSGDTSNGELISAMRNGLG